MSKMLERTDYDMEELAARIRDFRNYLGVTCGEFGERIGYSATYINQIELAIREAPAAVINLICDNYRIEEGYFSGSISLADAVKDIPTKADIDSERSYRLKKLRMERGLTQRRMADITGVDFRTISKIETGVQSLDNAQAKMIADGLNIGVDWLLYGREDRKKYPVNERLVEWLCSKREIRKMLWDACNAEEKRNDFG